MVWVYTIISVVIVSLISILAAIPFLIKKDISQKFLLVLLSISVGAMLATVFIHFLPEALHEGDSLTVAIFVLTGFMIFFIIEKFIHSHHHHNKKHKSVTGHSHGYHLAPINLIGDGIHNFLDGLVIAGSYLVSVPLGIAATIAVIFHEVPQELADFGVLLYAGLSRMKALLFNFFSAATAIVGAIVGLVLGESMTGFESFIIPFAAGTFLYIAASNLLPELHRHCGWKDTIVHVLAMTAGIGIMIVVSVFGPAH